MNSDSFFDGNAAAGALSEVFCVDVTSADGQCAGCGNVAALAKAHVFAFEPGIVIRCAACENSLVRLVNGEGRTWLDVRGLVYLELRTP